MKSKPAISLRGSNVPKSAIRKLIPFSKEAERNGLKVHKLNIGQPDVETPEEFWTAVKSFEEKVLAYSPSEGRPEYINAMVEYYKRHNINVSSDEIITTVGGIEGILITLFAVANPGDEIITPEPYYSNYVGVTEMADLKFVPITTTAENGYHLPSVSEIEKKISARTKAILIASPGNPTGCVYTREEMSMVASLAVKHGLFVISDEVYREFSYNGEPVTSIMHIKGVEKNAILVDSVSKRYSACGARLGCVISKNKELIDSVKAYVTVRLSAPTLDQIGIAACINTQASYFDKVREDYKNRRDVVVNAMNLISDVVCPSPGGAFYAMVKIKGVNTEVFAKWLLTDFSYENETVLVAPGSGFYSTPELGNDEIRIAYVLNVETMKRAMIVLSKAIESFRKL
jgi:aspartate aminotransferase